MINKYLAAGLVATTILAAPAYAQNNAASSSSAPAGQAVTGPNGVQFYTQTTGDADWRASKFMGVDIYGTNNEKIGDVKDIVLDHQGVIQAVVIGVGGFLGIGEKNVAVPFKSVDWSTQPMRSNAAANTNATTNNATAMNNTNASGGAALNGTAAGTDVTGTTNAGNAKIAYPDHGVLRLTKDELKSAPTYRYPDDAKATNAQ
jgi:sporulation protein YlmC with PRC-barrel domain